LSLKIKQGFAPFSDKVYRSQRINIGLIFERDDSEAVDYHVIQDVMIEAKEFTDVPIPPHVRLPSAFVINDSELAYGLFIIDP
jgi:hypothetical protein